MCLKVVDAQVASLVLTPTCQAVKILFLRTMTPQI